MEDDPLYSQREIPGDIHKGPKPNKEVCIRSSRELIEDKYGTLPSLPDASHMPFERAIRKPSQSKGIQYPSEPSEPSSNPISRPLTTQKKQQSILKNYGERLLTTDNPWRSMEK